MEQQTADTIPETDPSMPTIISSLDLASLREATLRAAIALKEAQLAEAQKDNLTLRIYLKYNLTSSAQIQETTGEIFYKSK